MRCARRNSGEFTTAETVDRAKPVLRAMAAFDFPWTLPARIRALFASVASFAGVGVGVVLSMGKAFA